MENENWNWDNNKSKTKIRSTKEGTIDAITASTTIATTSRLIEPEMIVM